MANKKHCGFIAVVGRPNVGKSTLLNGILAKKVSITSNKPQTTRQQIYAIKTDENTQYIFIDTPGIHDDQKNLLHRRMNKAAKSCLNDVDCILIVVEAGGLREQDEQVLNLLKKIEKPKVLLINKIDRLKDKAELLPLTQKLNAIDNYTAIIPLSALKQDNLHAVLEAARAQLPEDNFHFDAEQYTDKSEKFAIAEIVREKLIRFTSQELPYATTVEVESWQEKNNTQHIHVLIWVEKSGQKMIVIGKNGEKLKSIGTQARKEIEKLLGKKVFLKLWVKVKEDWSNDQRSLTELGFYE